ncbi:MAG: kelch repeat-containing protein [Nannocystaceae bacterium]
MSHRRRRADNIAGTDGTVLVPGGVLVGPGGLTDTVPVAAVDRFDPATNTWSTLPDMASPRAGHGMLPLADGDVLVVGGWAEDVDQPLVAVDRFDLETSTWQPATPLPEPLSHVLTVVNGELRVVLGRAEQPRAYAWIDEAWLPIAAPANQSISNEALPFGSGFVLAGPGLERAVIYDPEGDQWLPTPDAVDEHPAWLSGMTDYVQAAALLGPHQLFVLATTAGANPDIEQQGVAASLSRGATSWQGGAPGPLFGDVGTAEALGFAPGWVLVAGLDQGDVYDAASDAWCRTTEAPSPAIGATVVLEDGSVLFTGALDPEDLPLRWTPW